MADFGRKLTKADLMRIEAEDILQSRVFEEGAERRPTPRRPRARGRFALRSARWQGGW